MESKKINQLATEMSPAISDLTIIGDPITGVSKKITLLQIADLFQTTGTVTSVAVTESGNALNITGSPITTAGTINIGFAGSANQYVRGDGALAPFPTSTGGGSSVSYYLNGSVNQGTFGGSTYYQMSKDAVIGVGTNFSTSSNGLIAQFITDANDPDVVQIPSGNWNIEFFMNVSASSGALASFYVEIYKYNGSTFTLLATNSATPEELTNTTTVDAYYTSVAMPTSALSVTDRLAIRIYANVASKTVTLYTEDNRLCQVVTTFSKGMSSLNNLTDQSQFIATGTSGTNFNIVSSGDTHTFNLPVASATNTGKLSSTDWSTFNAKQPAGNYVTLDTTQTITAAKTFTQNLSLDGNGSNAGTLLLKNNTISPVAIGYASINSNGNNINLTAFVSATKTASFDLSGISDNIPRTFTFPDASGTIALTSNLSSYVPYTGATADVDLGSRYFKSTGVQTESAFTFKILASGTPFQIGYSVISSLAGNVSISQAISAGNLKAFTFDFSAWATNTTRTFTLPDASGTIALTNQLTGGTVTSVGLSSATSGVTIGSSPITTSGTITLAIATASGSQNGLLSSTDWTTFNNKQNALTNPITGTGTRTALYLPLFSGTNTITNSSISEGEETGVFVANTLTVQNPLTVTSYVSANAFIPTDSNVPTNGMYRSAANTLAFATNTTPRMFITSGGNLGVGTDNPTSVITAFSNSAATQFKAAGTAPAFTFSQSLTTSTYACVFGLATSANHFITGTAAGDMAIANQSATAGAIVFGTGTAEKMRMSSSGNFGIGTSIPVGRLMVYGSSAGNIFTSLVSSQGGSTQVGINFAPSMTDSEFASNQAQASIYATDSNYGANIIFANKTTGAVGNSLTERMRISSGGLVGIGTSSPASGRKLTVAGGAQFTYTDNGGASFNIVPGTNGQDGADFNLSYYTGTGYGPLTFTLGGSERMRITSGGYLLLGTTTSIYGQAGRGTFEMNGSTDNILVQKVGGSLANYLYSDATKSELYSTNFLQVSVNGAERMRILPSGSNYTDVCIGTTTTSYGGNAGRGTLTVGGSNTALYALQVGGTARAYLYCDSINTYLDNANGTGDVVVVNGTGGVKLTRNATSWTSNSDERLKNINSTIDNALAKLMTLRAVNFSWKSDETNKENLGLIAQDVEKVFPQLIDKAKLVSTIDEENNDETEYLGVRYTELVPVLIKAIQEQQAQIEELKSLINK